MRGEHKMKGINCFHSTGFFKILFYTFKFGFKTLHLSFSIDTFNPYNIFGEECITEFHNVIFLVRAGFKAENVKISTCHILDKPDISWQAQYK